MSRRRKGEREWGAGGGDGKAKCFFFWFWKRKQVTVSGWFLFCIGQHSGHVVHVCRLFLLFFFASFVIFFFQFALRYTEVLQIFIILCTIVFGFSFFFCFLFVFFYILFLLAFWFSTSRFFFFCFCRNYIKTHYINHLLHSLSVLSFLVVLVKQRSWRLTTKTMSMVGFSNSKITCKHTHNILLTTRYPTYCFSIRYKD